MLTLALVFQMSGLPQPVTGPAINTILFVAVMMLGSAAGILIGILTPLVAFLRGILPPLLAPMIPFIAIGNAVLVLVYALLSRMLAVKPKSGFTFKNIAAVAAGAGAKFLILAGAVSFLVEVPPAMARMMTIPQLYTALAGGFLAVLLQKTLAEILQANKE
ncbi:hypothetical protein SAMN04488692_10384 [Halarsenatibacter silvermanii]|uniref:ECF transporter S component n=1 Tax=Halarsenatibacter silvermanii TaxID=321763 RepID=A0A1G9IY33_9FIRM|nr:hypothetical protein SAMN04488692_10384 [Halarsenatibacter silvermanii]